MKKSILLVIIAILVVSVATAATVVFLFPYNPAKPPPAVSVNPTQEGMNQVASSNNQFAFELYSQLDRGNDNIFYSPYSIYSALAIVYEGANGKTADEIRSVFHFPDADVLRSNFAEIYNSINEGASDYTLRTGNALWVQKNYPLLKDYSSRVERYYGAKAANLDFAGETEKSRQTINSFIAAQTNNKIKELIAPGMLDPLTRLVITNAIYFKGTWKWQFDSSKTEEMDFRTLNGATVKAQMMFMEPEKTSFKYADTGKLQLLELPYKGDRLSMIIILPRDNLKEAEDSLTSGKLSQYEGMMKRTKINAIYLPKFKFNTAYTLNNYLQALGMRVPFTGDADFSGMTRAEKLMISLIVHKAFIEVNEEGTEAAAATGVIAEATSIRNEHTITFKADHPFIFIIKDNKTGSILFIGRVANPSS